MAIQQIPLPDYPELFLSNATGYGIIWALSDSIARCKREGVTYASGTWGYTGNYKQNPSTITVYS